MYLFTVAVLAFFFSFQPFLLAVAEENDGHFLNEWAAEIIGGERVAREIASRFGFEMGKQLGGLPDVYLLVRRDVPHRSRRSAYNHTKRLEDDPHVRYVAQQQEKKRVKRDMFDSDLSRISLSRGWPNDPFYVDEWYLSPIQGRSREDLRVKEVWKKGIAGKGVVVAIVDDGLEIKHKDMAANIDPEACSDLLDGDKDPTPNYSQQGNTHGTRCAGIIAMIANNKKCGVGVAFHAKIGGIRAVEGNLPDYREQAAYTYKPNHIDIYTSSWGPIDDGKKVDGPGKLAQRAMELGVQKGRNGKGSLYVWASGNGGQNDDNCNCDGYVSSIYTISVNSASQFGKHPYYAEQCSSTLTSTYSSGSYNERSVVTTDWHNECTKSFGGTSASAPLAAGILALLLQANPNLTWRDVQHIIVHTSRKAPLAKEDGWYKNGAGYCVNLKFGFGLMDALAMVELADPANWKHVEEQHVCRLDTPKGWMPQIFEPGVAVLLQFDFDGCQGMKNEVNYVEHVQIVVYIEGGKRGDIAIEMESPMGTVTQLMTPRRLDDSNFGFRDWPLTSVHNWGERARGPWKVRFAVQDTSLSKPRVVRASLVIYGTKEQPMYQKTSWAKCGRD